MVARLTCLLLVAYSAAVSETTVTETGAITEGEDKVRIITVIGERHSGTNYLRTLLESNLVRSRYIFGGE